ncbi:MAG: hypothetical protein JSR86_21105 [Proteobacteria bacterium]|nr:hypothetical protein [Pseudomonadota bacterium]
MADEKKPADEAPKHEEYHQAKKGVQDAGEIVTSAGGEPLSGTIADITDGDKRKKHK